MSSRWPLTASRNSNENRFSSSPKLTTAILSSQLSVGVIGFPAFPFLGSIVSSSASHRRRTYGQHRTNGGAQPLPRIRIVDSVAAQQNRGRQVDDARGDDVHR